MSSYLSFVLQFEVSYDMQISPNGCSVCLQNASESGSLLLMMRAGFPFSKRLYIIKIA